jgi:hypothetical protein
MHPHAEIHINLTLQKTTKNSLSASGNSTRIFGLLNRAALQTAYSAIEPKGIGKESYPIQVHEIFSWRRNTFFEDAQYCFKS